VIRALIAGVVPRVMCLRYDIDFTDAEWNHLRPLVPAAVHVRRDPTHLKLSRPMIEQGQGVFVPGTLAAPNQWSIYFRMSRKFQWGKAGAPADLAQYATRQTPLKGSVEGFVMELLPAGNYPAAGVTMSIDQVLTAITDADRHFRFPSVAEGRTKWLWPK